MLLLQVHVFCIVDRPRDQGFWSDEKNQRAYLAWLPRELGLNPDDLDIWYIGITARNLIANAYYSLLFRYSVTWDNFVDHYGAGFLKHFGSPFVAVKELFPKKDWLEWRFNSVPRGFWNSLDNQRRYLDWLGDHLGYKRFTFGFALRRFCVTLWNFL